MGIRRGLMRWALLVSSALVLFGGHVRGESTYDAIPPGRRKEMQHEVRVLIGLLENLHYRSRTFVEMKPEEILGSYMNRLDPLHLVFLGSDEKFLRRRFGTTMKSSYLLSGDLYPAFEIYDLFRERWSARLAWIVNRLGSEFDLEGDRTFDPERREAAYPAQAAAADESWERLLTAWILSERLEGRTQLEAVAAVARRVGRLDQALVSADPEAIEEAFLNSVLELRDPHSGYHSWDSMLDLGVEFEGGFAGVGIEVRRVGGDVVIVQVTPGGAAEASGRVHAGDRLIALGEEGGALAVTKSMRVRDVVRLLRGAPGTHVRLTLRAEGEAEARETSLERRRIAVESDRARAFLVSVPGAASGAPARPVGVINLPSFYGTSAVDGAATTSSADDVAELIRKLRERGMRGLVLDLRGNPGGRTDQAVRLAGLFIDTGPVMYLANGDAGGTAHPVVEEDREPGLLWDGPLVVLTSAGSASASELLAGALQAYDRAVVLGSGTTFGKGTSQAVVPLADAARRLGIAAGEHFGLVRITGQMFFLPNGNSTQLRGVASDIVVASASYGGERGESTLPGALPWSSIPVGDFDAVRARSVPGPARLTPDLRSRLGLAAAERMRSLAEFDWDRRRLAYRERNDAKGPVSLRLGERREAASALEEERRELVGERRRLAAALDWPWSPVRLDAVASQRAAHDEHVGQDSAGPDRDQAHIAHAVFYAWSATDSTWREVRLDDLDPRLLRDESEALAEAFASASGHPLGAAEFRKATLAFSEEEYGRAASLERSLAQAGGFQVADPAFQKGWIAALTRLIEFDPWLTGDPVPLDVPLREAVRVTLDWADTRPNATP